MREDVFGLGALRQVGPAPASALPRAAVTRAPSTFAAQLAQANKTRLNAAANKPYASPLKQQQQFANTHRAPVRRATPPVSTSVVSRPATSTSLSKSQPAQPPVPVKPPEAARPTTLTTGTAPLPLDQYPHPNGDNGRGMHWIPTAKQSHAVVDRFVSEAQKMGVKWVTFLNDGAATGQNDYLVTKLVGAGIEPIMRLWSPKLEPMQGDVEGMVRHYVGMGVHYFQPYNEPNLNDEQPDGVASVDRYLNTWIPTAQAIVRGGGLPGFGSLAPGGDKNDIDFLTEAMAGLKSRGQLGALDKAWLSMHNYTHNHPIEQRADTDGFFKFRAYHQIMANALGRDIPIIGTEGGTFVGEQEDPALPAVSAQGVADMATQAYTYMRDKREPWNFAYSFWTIANDAGGGTDERFNAEALFKGDGTASPVVAALRAMGSA
jgi:hypothetical protein